MSTHKEFYRPKEIAKLGMIKNSTDGDNITSNYIFILRLIKNGKLKARDYSKIGARPFWLVHIDEIMRYKKEG